MPGFHPHLKISRRRWDGPLLTGKATFGSAHRADRRRPIAAVEVLALAVAISSELNVSRMVRIGLLAAFVPISALALVVAAYVLFNFDFWISNVSRSAKLFAAATVLLAAAMCFMLRQGSWTIWQQWIAALILILSIVELGYVLPGLFESLSRF